MSNGAGDFRSPLNRNVVVQTALRYVDEHGLEALSMHKLGAALGVTAMSLYNHVDNKDALLDGIVEELWSRIELAPNTHDDWRETIATLARALRDLVHRHPHAATLLTSRPIVPTAALRTFDALLRTLRGAGLPETRAIQLLRTMLAYALGFALTELSWSNAGRDHEEKELQRLRQISNMLPPDLPDELLEVGLKVCGACDMTAAFELSLQLMLRGLDVD
jgi:AcrR family transcriptional regulator